MRTLLLFSFAMIFSGTTKAQVGSAADFANFARYADANKEIMGKQNGIVLLGNSITDFWATQDPKFFKENGLIGRGISGQTSTQLLLRFRADVVELKPEAVVIHIGTNDVAENTGPYSEEQTVNNIASMVDIAMANDIKVFIATVVPSTTFNWRKELGNRSAMIVSLNKQLLQLAKDKGVGVVDYHAALRNDEDGMDAELAEDGVHPTPKGYQVMGATLMDAIK
ncbi:GDSL-type esterase/lipase family protein [Lewinella sp. 4G2]|uniref:GDSL-type esterase/lipase family protein n=1 Tax=Lewinella sp. 4G2 TaxID=1803372 RepID=UPI0007B4CF61|nr:GDSL-type esterase/lipase family protein [Lewinella sp. 4G2]OAV44895.1 hypothetical protein A3850_010500 [Lewinella sp. 4G2]